VRITVAIAWASLLAGCRGAPRSALERELQDQLTQQLGPVAKVDCPDQSPPLRCRVAMADHGSLPVRVFSESGQLRWALEGLVVSATKLEQQLRDQLEAIGVAVTAHCGPQLQSVIAGQRLSCQLPSLGVAWATIAADGSYSVEIAIGAALTARSEDLEESELDALSRALDHEQGTSDEGDEFGDVAEDTDDTKDAEERRGADHR
jgi:hypothetical protein